MKIMDEHNKDHKNSKEPCDHHNEKKEDEKTVVLKESEYTQLTQDAAKVQEYWDKCLRMQADLENTRKRLEREKQDFLKFANEGIIVELLNVLDDLERALELAQEKHQDQAAFLKGVEMILSHLYEMLKDYGVKPIEAKGKIFDPNFHEALLQEENKEFPQHTIIEELQKGYLLNERVIRTTKVKVTKN